MTDYNRDGTAPASIRRGLRCNGAAVNSANVDGFTNATIPRALSTGNEPPASFLNAIIAAWLSYLTNCCLRSPNTNLVASSGLDIHTGNTKDFSGEKELAPLQNGQRCRLTASKRVRAHPDAGDESNRKRPKTSQVDGVEVVAFNGNDQADDAGMDPQAFALADTPDIFQELAALPDEEWVLRFADVISDDVSDMPKDE